MNSDDLAQGAEPATRAATALAAAAQAFARLLTIAEQGGDQARRVARFVASIFDGQAFPYDLRELRAFDAEVSDDMLACLDGLRLGRVDLHTLVADGDNRVRRMCQSWGLRWPARVPQGDFVVTLREEEMWETNDALAETIDRMVEVGQTMTEIKCRALSAAWAAQQKIVVAKLGSTPAWVATKDDLVAIAVRSPKVLSCGTWSVDMLAKPA